MLFPPNASTASCTPSSARICANADDPRQGPAVLRALEKLGKSALFGCHDCGDCSLPDIGYLCAESQCEKNQRNGPCGGTNDGRCENNPKKQCIWARAYDRLKYEGREQELLAHVPVVQDQRFRADWPKQGFTLVVDGSTNQQQAPVVLYASPSVDITKPIIEAYNLKSGVPAPAAAPTAPAAAPAAPAAARRRTPCRWERPRPRRPRAQATSTARSRFRSRWRRWSPR